MKISLIAAVAQNGVIGQNNDLPWHLPDDFAFFKRKTSHHAIILGRKSLEALGKPLPNRTSIVITRNTSFAADKVTVVHSLEDALFEAKKVDKQLYQTDELFVIGGAEIYKMALPVATTLYLTEINQTYEGDAHFPAFDRHDWQEVHRHPHPADERHAVSFDFVEYERTNGQSQ